MLELWRLLGRPARGRLFLALAFAALSGASGVMLLGLSGWFLTAAALAGLSGGGYVFNHLYPSAGIRAMAFSRVLARYAEQLVGHDATLGMSAALRPEVFAASARVRRGFMPLPTADLAAITDDVDAAESGFLRVISPLFAIGASVFVALGFAFAADPLAGFVALSTTVLMAVVVPMQVIRATRAGAAEAARLGEDARRLAARVVENAVELDTFDALGDASDAVRLQLDRWAEVQRRVGLRFRRTASLTGASGALVGLFLVWRGVSGAADLPLSVAAALAMIAALDAAAAMVSVLDASNAAAQAAARLASRLRQRDASWNPPHDAARAADGLFPLLADDLAFAPAEGAEPVGPVSLAIDAGDILQLVGPSGVGKSTMAEGLMRLHPLHAGVLRYNGIDADELRMASVLEHVAYAPQLPAFLPGTLREQLIMARPGATQAAIDAALATACADDFLASSQHGLATRFADGAYPFSGGELRRLGIARALLAEPALLILDEPLAGLDDALADRLVDRLKGWVQAKPGRALLVLAHEPSERFGRALVRLQPVDAATVT